MHNVSISLLIYMHSTMQGNDVRNNLLSNGNNFIPVEINNNVSQKGLQEKNFINGLLNARNILTSLERSLRKSRKYEKQLLQCKAAHSYSHSVNEWWSDASDEKQSKCSKTGTTKSSRSLVHMGESWATMSIVCLQYQYEELTKRYESLLQLYDERCSSLHSRNAALARLCQRARVTHARLADAHKTLLAIGDKYLALRERRLAQKSRYEEELKRLRVRVSDVMAAAERARLDLDTQITRNMAVESDSATSLLLAEIRKCNLLFLENLRLKAQIEKLTPGQVVWET